MKDPVYCNNFYQFRILINKTYKSIVEECRTKIHSLKYQVMILLLLNIFGPCLHKLPTYDSPNVGRWSYLTSLEILSKLYIPVVALTSLQLACLSVSICLPLCMSIYMSIYLSVCFSIFLSNPMENMG